MKIAITVSRYLPADLSGAEAIAQVNAEYLVKAGHSVTVLTSFISRGQNEPRLLPEEWINGVRVLRFKIIRFEQLNLLRKTYVPPARVLAGTEVSSADRPPSCLARAVFAFIFNWLSWLLSPGLFLHLLLNKYDVLHLTPFPHTHIWVAARAASLARIPLVLTPAYHVAVQKSMGWQLCQLVKKVSKLAVFTERERLDLAEIGIPLEKMVTIPPGLVPPDFETVSGQRFRTAHQLEKAPVVLFAGTKSFDKGFVHLIEAMRIVCDTHPSAVLVAMGPEVGQLYGDCMCKQLRNAINLGFLHSEKWDVYDACDLFVMPSRCDSFGLVYAEAWLCGKPVIGARCGSVPWVIREGTDGLLVPFGNVEELAKAILRLIDDPLLRASFGASGKASVRKNYTAPVVAQRLLELYECVAKKRR